MQAPMLQHRNIKANNAFKKYFTHPTRKFPSPPKQGPSLLKIHAEAACSTILVEADSFPDSFLSDSVISKRISCDIFYPEEEEIRGVVLFLCGFAYCQHNYDTLLQELAKQGIVALAPVIRPIGVSTTKLQSRVSTESIFWLDLFLNNPKRATPRSSIFRQDYLRVVDKTRNLPTGVMGHSMGGGLSYVVAGTINGSSSPLEFGSCTSSSEARSTPQVSAICTLSPYPNTKLDGENPPLCLLPAQSIPKYPEQLSINRTLTVACTNDMFADYADIRTCVIQNLQNALGSRVVCNPPTFGDAPVVEFSSSIWSHLGYTDSGIPNFFSWFWSGDQPTQLRLYDHVNQPTGPLMQYGKQELFTGIAEQGESVVQAAKFVAPTLLQEVGYKLKRKIEETEQSWGISDKITRKQEHDADKMAAQSWGIIDKITRKQEHDAPKMAAQSWGIIDKITRKQEHDAAKMAAEFFLTAFQYESKIQKENQKAANSASQ